MNWGTCQKPDRIEARGPKWKSYPDYVAATFDDGIWVRVLQHGSSYRIEVYDGESKVEIYSFGYTESGGNMKYSVRFLSREDPARARNSSRRWNASSGAQDRFFK